MDNYFNPYTDLSFFSFFRVFFGRLWDLCSGSLAWSDLVSDEIQIFVLSGVAASAALAGVFLVLRKMSMLANALSHTILLGIVSAYLVMHFFSKHEPSHHSMSLPLLLVAALITGVVTTFLTEVLHRYLKLQEDASIGLVFTTLFAAGILVVTLFTRNVHVGSELIMGNVDALRREDMQEIAYVFMGNLFLFFCFFKGFKITTFDPDLARTLGFSPLFFNYLLMILTSASAIGAFKAVGVLMVLAFFILPALIARLLTDRLIPLLFLAVGIGCTASFFGVALSRHILSFFQVGLSTGGIVVCVLVLFFVLAVVFSPRGLLSSWRHRSLLKSAHNS